MPENDPGSSGMPVAFDGFGTWGTGPETVLRVCMRFHVQFNGTFEPADMRGSHGGRVEIQYAKLSCVQQKC